MILDPSLVPGTPLMEALDIQPDVVFDLSIETNRPDALCMAGIARDLAAKLGLPFSIPTPTPVRRVDEPAGVTVDVIDTDLCTRFTATVFRGITVGPSDPLVARRLGLAGMRSINNVVDASNYVMLELGQPTHAYDLDRLGGNGFKVRAARAAESIETLDGVTRTMPTAGRYAMICDGNDEPIGIAGIMGGANTEISDSTVSTVLEAAHFAKFPIVKASRQLALRSEASMRFERGTDPAAMPLAIARFAELLGADVVQVGETVDVKTGSETPRTTTLRISRVNQLLGTSLSVEQVAQPLVAIGFGVSPAADPDVLQVVIPTYRADASAEIDIVEEVARHVGYNKVARTQVVSPYCGGLNELQQARRTLKSALAGGGFREIISATLIGPQDHQRAHIEIGADFATDVVNVTNPLASEESVYRASLLPSMLSAAAHNIGHRNADLRFFEFGRVAWSANDRVKSRYQSGLPAEFERVGLLITSPDLTTPDAIVAAVNNVFAALRKQSPRLVNDGALAGRGLHATRAVRVADLDQTIDNSVVPFAWLGEVDPRACAAFGINQRVLFAEIDFELLVGAAEMSRVIAEPSKLPTSDVDLAFVVPDSHSADDVARLLVDACGASLETLSVVDVYRDADKLGAGVRSIAYRLRLTGRDHTLSDVEIADLRDRCVKALVPLGVTLR
jgi:phenylalanyl-tRNA synthetase beta chain